MRGDSIRDLYAKTMALLGLGVLAGAGALVDYWPVGVSFPQAGSALEVPSVAAALPPSSPVVPVLPRPVPLAISRYPDFGPVMTPALMIEPLPVADMPRVDLGQQVSLVQPTSFETAVGPEMVGESVSVLAADYQSAALMMDDGGVFRSPVDSESDGLITGAFKKAGSSIVKTGVRTGASLFDVARVIGGAVRKALPN